MKNKFHYWADLDDGAGMRMITKEQADKICEENKRLFENGKPDDMLKIRFVLKTEATF